MVVTAITTIQEPTTPYNKADVKVGAEYDVTRGNLSGNKFIFGLHQIEFICFENTIFHNVLFVEKIITFITSGKFSIFSLTISFILINNIFKV